MGTYGDRLGTSNTSAPDFGRLASKARTRQPPPAPSWFVLPAVLVYAFVVLIPSVRGAFLAFTNWNGIDPIIHFIGIANFEQIIHDPAGRGAVVHTLIITIVVTFLQNVIGLGLAIGVNSRIKTRGVLRVLLYAPAVMTPVVTGYIWQYILSPQGSLNTLLAAFHLAALQQDWLGTPDLALASVILVIVWQFSGTSMIIFLAGLQAIPPELDEAAACDGSSSLAKLRHIQIPLLAPAMTISVMVSSINGIKIFDQVYILTGGGPGTATETISTLMYQDAFTLNEYGYGIAMALTLTVIAAAISSAQYAVLRSRESIS